MCPLASNNHYTKPNFLQSNGVAGSADLEVSDDLATATSGEIFQYLDELTPSIQSATFINAGPKG